MFKIVQLKFQNLQLSFQNFTTPIAKFTTQIAKFTTECLKFCLGVCGTPPTPPRPAAPDLEPFNGYPFQNWTYPMDNMYAYMTKL